MYPARSTAACPWPLAWSPLRGCSTAAPAPVFSKGPLPHQHAIDATHFEANAGPSTPSTRRRRSAAPSRRSIPLDAVVSARLWAGPFCSSRRPSRSAWHESKRMGLSRTGRIGRLAAHCAEARAVSALRAARALAAFWLPWVFCSLLRVRVLVLQVAWRGVGVCCLV